jgi:predicted DNA-binding transcriptional regulator AlpA
MTGDRDFTPLTRDYYTSAEVCERAGIGITGLHQIIRRDPGFPRPHRYGAKILLHRAEAIEEWLSTYRKGRTRSKR